MNSNSVMINNNNAQPVSDGCAIARTNATPLTPLKGDNDEMNLHHQRLAVASEVLDHQGGMSPHVAVSNHSMTFSVASNQPASQTSSQQQLQLGQQQQHTACEYIYRDDDRGDSGDSGQHVVSSVAVPVSQGSGGNETLRSPAEGTATPTTFKFPTFHGSASRELHELSPGTSQEHHHYHYPKRIVESSVSTNNSNPSGSGHGYNDHPHAAVATTARRRPSEGLSKAPALSITSAEKPLQRSSSGAAEKNRVRTTSTSQDGGSSLLPLHPTTSLQLGTNILDSRSSIQSSSLMKCPQSPTGVASQLKDIKNTIHFEDYFMGLDAGQQLSVATMLFSEHLQRRSTTNSMPSAHNSDLTSMPQRNPSTLSFPTYSPQSLSPRGSTARGHHMSVQLPYHLQQQQQHTAHQEGGQVVTLLHGSGYGSGCASGYESPSTSPRQPYGGITGNTTAATSITARSHPYVELNSMLHSVQSMHLPRSNRVRESVPEDAHGYEVLNDYTILDEIGSGASGTVMLALHSKSQDPFAIKAVSKSRKLKFGRALPTFDIEKEVAVMKKLKHPNIVRLHEVIDDPEEHMMYLVMDYVPNGPLFETTTDPVTNSITCTPIDDEKLLLKNAKQIADGLRFLHKRNIVHRDIKPDNILLGYEGKVYIADFGISEVLQGNGDGTGPMGAKGTPAFFAPEQCRGEALTPASDVWSFGVVLYLAKFGKLPFPGHGTIPSLVHDIIENDLTFPEGTDPIWEDCLRRLLQKDVSQRMTLKTFLAHPLMSPGRINDDNGHLWINNNNVGGTAAMETIDDFSPTRTDVTNDPQLESRLNNDEFMILEKEEEGAITARTMERVAFFSKKACAAIEEKAEVLLPAMRATFSKGSGGHDSLNGSGRRGSFPMSIYSPSRFTATQQQELHQQSPPMHLEFSSHQEHLTANAEPDPTLSPRGTTMMMMASTTSIPRANNTLSYHPGHSGPANPSARTSIGGGSSGIPLPSSTSGGGHTTIISTRRNQQSKEEHDYDDVWIDSGQRQENVVGLHQLEFDAYPTTPLPDGNRDACDFSLVSGDEDGVSSTTAIAAAPSAEPPSGPYVPSGRR